MEDKTSIIFKKVKTNVSGGVSSRTSITCSNVPDCLLDANNLKKHFHKFGQVMKIVLRKKKQMCIIEYDQPAAVEKALLNAGAYDGFMFDVTRTRQKQRRNSKKDDDPDWVPDSDVEEELAAMSGTPIYRTSRQKPMDIENPSPIKRTVKIPVIKKSVIREKAVSKSSNRIESPVTVGISSNTLSTADAASDLHQLRSRISLTTDEQWRTLDARDKILRSWGGNGPRIKAGGATIGTCQDMCPEKERLHRQAEHQVMTLEAVPESDGMMDPWRAVKQYSRSSADQEMPMCYELRPARVLRMTCLYLLHEIADNHHKTSLADWFHFMWDRLRGIRKDITQQALCCTESIYLVEMCARFHAHCAARLADLEHTQFDQKLNTDNLTKCLQTLKHMYADAKPEQKPREAEFRGYIALLNLGDSNFWWEVKQLPREIQKSEDITFAIQVFNAIDNNNYVRFFRLIREKASYLQACILLRYFNDVRARGLARIVKAFSPRGGSRYPARDLIKSLAFENIESMTSFISHYGLRLAKIDDTEVSIILDRKQFIEDSDPYPLSRSINLIESKRQCSVGEIIAGGCLPEKEYKDHKLHSSFNADGTLKESALVVEDQGYSTTNDSNKNMENLKSELLKLSQSGKSYDYTEKTKPIFSKTESIEQKFSQKLPLRSSLPKINVDQDKKYCFQPAIPVASMEIIKTSPEKVIGADYKNLFSFSKPQESANNHLWGEKPSQTMLEQKKHVKNLTEISGGQAINIFSKSFEDKHTTEITKAQIASGSDNAGHTNLFLKKDSNKTDNESNKLFGNTVTKNDANSIFTETNKSSNIFSNVPNKNIFAKTNNNIFGQQKLESNNIFKESKVNLFSKPDNVANLGTSGNIFTKTSFGQVSTDNLQQKEQCNIFGKDRNKETMKTSNIFQQKTENGSLNIFKSAINPPQENMYSIFQSKNHPSTSVAENIFTSVNKPSIYDFESKDENINNNTILEKQKEYDENKILEQKRQEDIKRLKEEEDKKIEEARRKQEEMRKLEEIRRQAEKKENDIRKKMEEEKRQADLKKKPEEEAQRFKNKVDKESLEVVKELINEINTEFVTNLLKEEIGRLRQFLSYADVLNNEIITELCKDICNTEMKVEIFLANKIKKKWFNKWRIQLNRNKKRRKALENTPVWLPDKALAQEVCYLRRQVEASAIANMNAIHTGYRFSGEMKSQPIPQPYILMDIIRSPFLKRMKQINYPYDKCFFWKITIVSPGPMKWINRKVEVEPWLHASFSDNKKHDTSETLIQVHKYSWNNLMDFAISVSLVNDMKTNIFSDALEGSNALLFYTTENDDNLCYRIENILSKKYPYQLLPVAIIIPSNSQIIKMSIDKLLATLVSRKVISCFKLFVVDQIDTYESLNIVTISALKWLAKMFPPIPSLEIDYLKSLCQTFLGNEIWYRWKLERHTRLCTIFKDLHRLVKLYNLVVDKLTDILTNEDLFNYPSFPLEFKEYLNESSPYPKPFEFIPSNVKCTENSLTIKEIMAQLKLPAPNAIFCPENIINLQEQIRSYCNQIGWFEDPEEVVCKVVAVIPNDLNCEQFNNYFESYDLLDLLNIVVYEKIRKLYNFDNRYAIYEKSVLEDYRNTHWWYESGLVKNIKHKYIDFEEDYVDYAFIAAKRRKLLDRPQVLLTLEDKDTTLVEENIKITDEKISKYNYYSKTVQELEAKLEEERKKAIDLENVLKAALADY